MNNFTGNVGLRKNQRQATGAGSLWWGAMARAPSGFLRSCLPSKLPSYNMAYSAGVRMESRVCVCEPREASDRAAVPLHHALLGRLHRSIFDHLQRVAFTEPL